MNIEITKSHIIIGVLSLIIFSLCLIGFYSETDKPVAVAEQSNISVNTKYTKNSPNELIVTTPSKSEYTGSGREITRETHVWGIANPFEISPGEVVSRLEPLKLEESDLPAFHMGKDGVNVEKGAGSESSTGGLRWSILDTIWFWIKKLMWFGIIGGIAAGAIFFLVPGAQPIIGGLFRVISSIIPFVGSIVERVTAKVKWQTPLEHTVNGGDCFKDMINTSPDFTDEQKIKVKQMFKLAMMSKQDGKSQNVVDRIKIKR